MAEPKMRMTLKREKGRQPRLDMEPVNTPGLPPGASEEIESLDRMAETNADTSGMPERIQRGVRNIRHARMRDLPQKPTREMPARIRGYAKGGRVKKCKVC